MEPKAIGRFLLVPVNLDLIGFMPEACSSEELVALAELELTYIEPQDKRSLLKMFRELM